ncbi:NAD(P)H-binding protein [Streptomyces sp. NPDC048604]|uniref:NAD(P)H-binding protein n=1 Tax=Streptomyces sp. NPDC048604 TaxID=3365578 RepID=UPI00371791C5
MTILVTGSRGRVATALLSLLHTAGLEARAASKKPGDLSPPPGVEAVRCDLADPDTFGTALAGVDSVFLYAEPAHIDAFTARARAAGVEHVVLLSSSSVLAPNAAENPIAGSHLAVERALEAAAADGSFEATHLQPGAFATNALGWAAAIRSTGAVDLPYPGAHTDPIHERDVAEAAFAVLTEPKLRGSSYLLSGPESLTFAEQLAVLAQVTGRDIEVREPSPAAWRASVAPYIPGTFADALLRHWADHDGVPVPTTGTVEELTGHPARTFAAWATEHAKAFHSA